MLNFCFTYCLPRDFQLVDGLAEDSDNEGLEDDLEVALDEADMVEASRTRIKGSSAGHEAGVQAAGATSTKLADMTKRVFALSSSIWLKEAGEAAPQQMQQATENNINHDVVKQAARASRNKALAQQRQPAGLLGMPLGEPEVRERRPVSAAGLREWLYSSHVAENTNAKQHHFLRLVVDRLLVEFNLASPEEVEQQSREPTRMLLHGPPGAGKSHCLVFLRELFDMVGFKEDVDYAVLAFQTTNASSLCGNTIHHAFGFNLDKHRRGEAAAIAASTAKRLSFLRWIFVDEHGERLFAGPFREAAR